MKINLRNAVPETRCDGKINKKENGWYGFLNLGLATYTLKYLKLGNNELK